MSRAGARRARQPTPVATWPPAEAGPGGCGGALEAPGREHADGGGALPRDRQQPARARLRGGQRRDQRRAVTQDDAEGPTAAGEDRALGDRRQAEQRQQAPWSMRIGVRRNHVRGCDAGRCQRHAVRCREQRRLDAEGAPGQRQGAGIAHERPARQGMPLRQDPQHGGQIDRDRDDKTLRGSECGGIPGLPATTRRSRKMAMTGGPGTIRQASRTHCQCRSGSSPLVRAYQRRRNRTSRPYMPDRGVRRWRRGSGSALGHRREGSGRADASCLDGRTHEGAMTKGSGRWVGGGGQGHRIW